MQHAVDQATVTPASELTRPTQNSVVVPATATPSSADSPKSEKASIEPVVSQVSESTVPSSTVHELTPPSSVASSQEQRDVEGHLSRGVRVGDMAAPLNVTGKKRTANGQVKETVLDENRANTSRGLGHARTTSTLSQVSSTSLGELSQQLRTKLTYAMVKVQNGWQKHSLDEIESIASQSPRSNFSGFGHRDYQALVSPRVALSAGMRHGSKDSSSSDHTVQQYSSLPPLSMAEPTSHSRKTLAPPAPIISGNRRKPTPNMHLQINSLKASSRPARPTSTQRTPSQNAAMEADAVETLLFMSASPNNSGHFPSHLSTYSPTSQAFSTQTSPLKAHFEANDRNYSGDSIGYSPRASRNRTRYEDKAALIDRLLHDLDDDESEELDRAVKIMEQYRAAKLSA